MQVDYSDNTVPVIMISTLFNFLIITFVINQFSFEEAYLLSILIDLLSSKFPSSLLRKRTSTKTNKFIQRDSYAEHSVL